jgi:hypothetical protein
MTRPESVCKKKPFPAGISGSFTELHGPPSKIMVKYFSRRPPKHLLGTENGFADRCKSFSSDKKKNLIFGF